MDTDCRVEIARLLCELVAYLCIVDVTCSEKELFYAEHIRSIDHFVKVLAMNLLAVVLALIPFI
jgi:hypothetical protein